MSLLEPREMEMLERLALGTRGRLLGFFSGDHRSKRFGSSMDFADYREYRPGDDFRRIDTALSARLDRLFLKLYEAEEDVPVRVVLDCSASMGFGDPVKLRLGAAVAAAFAHVGLVQQDRVRLYAARAGGAQASRWLRGTRDSMEAMAWLASQRAAGDGGARETVRAIREEGRHGILILISDLLEPSWEETVTRLAPPGEAAVVQILSPQETAPPLEGDLTLVDSETGHEVELSVTADVLAAYRKRLDAWSGAVRSACTSRGIAHVLTASDTNVIDLFMRTLRREGAVR